MGPRLGVCVSEDSGGCLGDQGMLTACVGGPQAWKQRPAPSSRCTVQQVCPIPSGCSNQATETET